MDNEEPLIQPHEVTFAIRHTKAGKAPGPDNIPPQFYKSCAESLLHTLTRLYNAILTHSHIPNQFKQGKVIFIKKPGKPGDRPGHFRPITLLNVIGKIFEKIIYNRITHFAQKTNWISPDQFGYQTKISAEDALCRLTNNIQRTYKRKGETLVVFFDVSGAFNDLWHYKLLHTLIQKKCPPIYTKIIESFLHNRHIHSSDFPDVTRTLTRGTPQGSVLSPLLWNIFYNDLHSTIKQKYPNSNITLFADDLAITLTIPNARHRTRIQNKMNKIIQLVSTWGSNNLLRFNPEKTTAVLFSKLNQPRKYPRTKITLRMDHKHTTSQKSPLPRSHDGQSPDLEIT
jgi:retron-type reverse transcriptase